MNKYCGLICLLSSAICAVAQESKEEFQFYLSGSIDRAFGEINAGDMNDRMASLGYQANAKVYGQNRNAWDIALGYRVTRYLDVQIGYADLGEVRTHLSGNAIDIRDYLNSANLVHPRSADGFTLAVRGRYYLNEDFFLYGRVGAMKSDSKYFADANIDQAARTKNETSFFFGIGYEYEWRPDWSLHFGGDMYRVEGESIKVFGLGLAYLFGSTSKKNSAPVATVREVPAEAPLQVEEPVVPVPLEIELAIIFDTNSAVVKSEFYREVEGLAGIMTQHPNIKVVLGGHTDNRGDDKHNQVLSQRRVDAVKELLISQYGVDEQRIGAQGFGESQPVADNETQEGRARNRRVVAHIAE